MVGSGPPEWRSQTMTTRASGASESPSATRRIRTVRPRGRKATTSAPRSGTAIMAVSIREPPWWTIWVGGQRSRRGRRNDDGDDDADGDDDVVVVDHAVLQAPDGLAGPPVRPGGPFHGAVDDDVVPDARRQGGQPAGFGDAPDCGVHDAVVEGHRPSGEAQGGPRRAPHATVDNVVVEPPRSGRASRPAAPARAPGRRGSAAARSARAPTRERTPPKARSSAAPPDSSRPRGRGDSPP